MSGRHPWPPPPRGRHASDCAVHNEPALPRGECDCGAHVAVATALPPLDTSAILWVAAIDLLPIEKRAEWVKAMEERVAYINTMRGADDGR